MLDMYRRLSKLKHKDDLMETFVDIEPWRDERNKLIHALLNKTAVSSEIAGKECAERGYDIIRALDNYLVKPFKRNNDLRKKYKIQ